jgi:hypothetical protein
MHDGSETVEDSVDLKVVRNKHSVLIIRRFQIWISSTSSLPINPQTLTLPLQIDPVDDLPQLILGPNGGILNVSPASKLV